MMCKLDSCMNIHVHGVIRLIYLLDVIVHHLIPSILICIAFELHVHIGQDLTKIWGVLAQKHTHTYFIHVTHVIAYRSMLYHPIEEY